MAITLSRSPHSLKNTSQFAPDCHREERTRDPEGVNQSRSSGGRPDSYICGCTVGGRRASSPPSLSPSAPPSSPSPPSSSRWSPSTSCAMVRFADCRDRRREWILRHSPGDRPGSRSLREMKGRESAEHRSDTQPRWSVTPNPGPHTRVRPCQRFCRRLYPSPATYGLETNGACSHAESFREGGRHGSEHL